MDRRGGIGAQFGNHVDVAGRNPTTSSGALLVCDQSVGCGDFAPGSTTMTNTFATNKPGSFGVALDRRENSAWTENPALSNGQLKRFAYPGPDARANKSLTVPGGGYAGVAVSPPAPQGPPY